jgi:DeoR/GlpR family transcriptional regulator of sugar metabolism
MMSEERRQEIVQMVQQLGRVEVGDLSRQFKTSEATIRSDLKRLHLQGFVQRTHGGALNPELVNIDRSLHQKSKLRAEEKQRIGKAAAALINDGESIILDSGTTTQQIAKHIKSRKNLKVITNGVNVAMELLGAPGIQLILLGGLVRQNSFSTVGHFAKEMLEQFSADKLFIGADACDLDFGITTPNMEESQVNQAMVRIVKEKILVADSSKFGKRSLARIMSLSELDKVISDSALPANIQSELRGNGVEVILA